MKLVAAALAALAVAALLWLASEQHYQGCVAAATANTVAPKVETEANPFNALDEGSGAERVKAVNGCSRLPF